jgi:hypothetical protein
MATSPHAAYDSNRNKRAIAEADQKERSKSNDNGEFLLNTKNTADGLSDNMVDE